ncbi:MAG: PQQ-binding-like beta-propeller repeat protein [Hyphomicrobium sp.]
MNPRPFGLRIKSHGAAPSLRALALGLTVVAALSGCSDSLPSLPKATDLNPFKEKVPPLPGKRIAVIPTQEKLAGELADGSSPIALPAAVLNDSWTQPGGAANNAPGHLQLTGTVRQTWKASAGKGSSKSGRVTASPIVYDGRIYTLDADGVVTAFSLSGGSSVWRAGLQPATAANTTSSIFDTSNLLSLGGADGGGYGGGLAADGGRIFAVSGYGTVIALDPATGNRVWEKSLGVPIRQSPTATGDRLYVVTTEGRLFCYSGTDGAELWAVRGLPQQASLGLNASPAVEGDLVVVPYSTGDLVALRASDGSALWSESLSRTRTTSQLASLSDAARPAIDSGTVFAVGHGGRMVATKAATGERLWSLNVPGTQTPWVAGESVFVVDTTGQLMAVNRRDGKLQWTAKLPGASNWSGPVLAGGTLWLASNKGLLVGVDPSTGRVTGQLDVGDPVYIAPIVAQGRLFILTDNAALIAYN